MKSITNSSLETASISVDSLSLVPPEDENRRSHTFKRLSQVVDLSTEEAQELANMSNSEREAEIGRLQELIKRYQMLMLLVAINSGWMFYTINMVTYYCKIDLGLSAAENSLVASILFLPWSFKPIWGFMSDSFNFFGYRFKGHFMIMSLVTCTIASSLMVFPKPSIEVLVMTLTLHSLACSYIDALAEGISAMVTKYNERIVALRIDSDHEKADSLKSFGLFNSLRGISRSIMMFVGGFVVEKTHNSHLFYSGMILASYPLFLCLVVFFVFKEDKNPIFFRGCDHFIQGLKKTARSVINKEALLPLVILVFYRLLPQLGQAYTYVLLSRGGWSFSRFNTSSFCGALLTNLALLFGFTKLGKYVKYNLLITTGLIMLGMNIMLSSSVLYAQHYDPFWYSVFWVLVTSMLNLSMALMLVTVVGRLSRLLPEGFESTGVTVIISINNISNSTGRFFSSVLLNTYAVKDGYFERLREPQEIVLTLSVLLIAICPLFVSK